MASSKKNWRKVMARFITCAVLISGIPLASANTAAINWLTMNANQDGSYWLPTDIATPYQSTSETINALSLVSPGTNIIPAVQFLTADTYHSTEYLARKIIARAAAGEVVTALVDELAQLQNEDGGFGELAGHDSTALDTAFALLAFKKAAYSNAAAISYAINFLVQQQQADGGFPLKQPNESAVYNTAIASMAMQSYRLAYNVGNNIQQASNFLLNRKISGAAWDSNWETAVSLKALVAVTTDATLYKSAVDILTTNQSIDGSWDGDVYITALVLQALHAVANVQLPTDPTTGVLIGKIVSASTGSPLSAVAVNVEAVGTGTAITGSSGDNGTFNIVNVPAGDYTITYTLDGYLVATQSVTLQVGQLIDLGTIKLTPVPSTAIMQGTVVDVDTGTAISGAEIALSGSTNISVQTDSAGKYRVVIAPGAVNVTVAAVGYQPAVVAITVIAGQIIEFSPGLVPDNSNNNDPAVTVSGQIVDADTNTPIAGALIVIDSVTVHQAVADGNGNFSITGIEAGQLTLTVSATDYKAETATIMATPSSNIEIGTVYLQATAPVIGSTVAGLVTDSSSGQPVVGAMVSIEGSGQATITDADGHYQIDQISQSDFSLFVSATGYLSGFVNVSMTEPKFTTVDFSLAPASAGGISIDNFVSDKLAYGAYQNAEVSLAISNGSAYSQTIIPLLELYDESNQLVRQLVLGDSNITGSPDQSYNLLPGGTLNVTANWYTGQLPPGNYKLHCRVLDKYSNQILAEKILVRTIEQTQNIQKLTLKTTPQFGKVGETVQIQFKADLMNKSNTAGDISFTYELSGPGGAIVNSGSATLQIGPDEVTKTFVLDSFQYTFVESGIYPLSLQISGGIQPEQIETVPISVSPSTRIEASQSVTPMKVTPDGDKRITVDIELKGVEAK